MMAAMFARDPVRVERMTQGAEDGWRPAPARGAGGLRGV